MVTTVRRLTILLTAAALTACVTINVYFPAAAAEQAADRIIQEVYGEPADVAPPQSRRDNAAAPALLALLDLLIAPARAQNIDISTPAVAELKNALAARHPRLLPHYVSGAVGLTGSGDLELRDLNAVPLAQRAEVQQLVSLDNRDRAALYREIALANGHPDWEDDIRATFARRWIANAGSGWWFRADGRWQRK